MNHIELGKKGEALACSFLLQKGYQIVTKNYRRKTGEIDLIAYDQETLVFVEVKSRRSTRFGLPSEAVNRRKQQKIITTALAYLQSAALPNQAIRFDVIEVYFPYQEAIQIHHLINAFGGT